MTTERIPKTRKVEMHYIPLEKLSPYPLNPRIHEGLSIITESITDFDLVMPILVDRDYQIIDGHGRWEAARQMGKREVPVIMLEDADELECKAIRLTMNRSAECENHWDMELVCGEVEDIKNAYDVEALGWSDADLGWGTEGDDDDGDDGGDLGGKPEIRCECPNCHKRFFLSECRVDDEEDEY